MCTLTDRKLFSHWELLCNASLTEMHLNSYAVEVVKSSCVTRDEERKTMKEIRRKRDGERKAKKKNRRKNRPLTGDIGRLTRLELQQARDEWQWQTPPDLAHQPLGT